jgi:serine/threonine protein kinase
MDVPISEKVPAVLQHADDDVLSMQEDTSASSIEATRHATTETLSFDEPSKQHEPGYGWYTFTWEHPASEIFVTGSFDNWTKSVKLTMEDGIFKKEVMLPKVSTMYKFVVDGHWTVNPSLPMEAFGGGIVNNVLSPEDIIYTAWAAMKEKADRRFAQGGEQDSWPQYSWQKDLLQDSGDDDEDLNSRVDWIKARVAELTSADVNPASEFMDGVTSQTAENGDQELISYVPLLQPHKDEVPNHPPKGYAEAQSTNETLSVNPKLDHILSAVNDEAALDGFQSHGISDLWLPIPQQTLRRLLGKDQKVKTFLNAQDENLDSELHVLSRNLSRPPNRYGHASIEDDEGLVKEIRALGEGACGTVEEVSILTRPAAIRCVRKRIGRPKQLKAQKTIMAAFAREIGVMRQVDHHHCVQFLGSYTDIDHVNILSYPVADMDLATFLDQPINDKEREVLYRGFGCLCNAIHYLHQNNIRHEDLKPQNVLIHGENILLTDFGFSLDFSEDSVSTTTGRPSAWTIRYSAPEVLEFEPRNRATDIYSLGCVLFEMMAGFYGTSLSELKAHWKGTGNGQSSFARNFEATVTSYRKHLTGSQTYLDTYRVEYFRRWIRIMLLENKDLRPTSQQIVNGLSDICILVIASPKWSHASCKGLSACTGLSQPRNTMNALRSRYWQLSSFPLLNRYIYPWLDERYAYSLWDLDLNVNTGNDKGDDPDTHWPQPGTQEYHFLRDACKQLYHKACRTGTTKMFWDMHTKDASHSIHEDFKEHASLSLDMLSLEQVVFRRLAVELTASAKSNGLIRVVYATLLPICLPRSTLYGTFFWMFSWSMPDLSGNNIPYDIFHDTSIVDLTTGS